MVANDLIIALGNTIDAYAKSGDAPPGWEPPQIAIQVGAGWNEGETEAIINQLSPKARSYLDEVLIHYYSEDLSLSTIGTTSLTKSRSGRMQRPRTCPSDCYRMEHLRLRKCRQGAGPGVVCDFGL